MSDDDAPGPEITPPVVPRDAHGRWRPGASPNPGGRSKRDREVSALFDRLTPMSLEILGQLAEQGDLVALQAILRHSVAPPKASTVRLDIGQLGSPADCLIALTRITQAVAAGEIDPAEAVPLIAAVEQARRTIEATDQEMRLQAVERQLRERAR